MLMGKGPKVISKNSAKLIAGTIFILPLIILLSFLIYLSITNDISIFAVVKKYFYYFLKGQGPMERILIAGLLIGLGNAIFLPINLLLFLTALIMPGWRSFAAGMIGALIAALIGNLYGRFLSVGYIREKLGKNFEIISREIARDGFKTVALLCLAPIAPYLLVNVLVGICRIPIWKQMAGTFIGFIPGITLLTLLGREMRSLVKEPGLQTILSILLILCMLWMSVRIGKRIKNKLIDPSNYSN